MDYLLGGYVVCMIVFLIWVVQRPCFEVRVLVGKGGKVSRQYCNNWKEAQYLMKQWGPVSPFWPARRLQVYKDGELFAERNWVSPRQIRR